MDSSFECTPALSDTSNNTVSSPNAASVTDTDRVINTKHDSVHVEGELCLKCEISVVACLTAKRCY